MPVRRIFILLFLVQATLLTIAPDFLSVWMDERFTLDTARLPVPDLLKAVAADIHPPLYYLIAHALGSSITILRLFSAACILACTALLYSLWWRKLRPHDSLILAAAWTLSPAVLLYGRMARSYSLQVLLVIAAVFAMRRFRRHPTAICAAIAGASLLAVFYTHYAPGAALLIAGNLWLLIQQRRPPVAGLILLNSIVAIGYLPWILVLSAALSKWGNEANIGAQYSLTGSLVKETIVKLGYGITTFAIGETFPFWIFPLTALFIFGLFRLSRSIPKRTSIFWLIAPATIVGYLGVARWVSYAFVPARLLWLLPFAQVAWLFPMRRFRFAVPICLAGVALVSTWSYAHRQDFRNKAYALPLEEIAADINRDGGRLILDPLNTGDAIRAYLKPEIPVSLLDRNLPVSIDGPFWIFRSTHDVSPGHIQGESEARLCAGHMQNRRYFLPYSEVERYLMQLSGVSEPLGYAFQLTHCIASTR